MKVNKIIFLEHGSAEFSAHVSADVTVNENRHFELRDFASDVSLRSAEIELAHDELVDRARCYPEG